jgi:uncharacterized protein (TIGR01319 family)
VATANVNDSATTFEATSSILGADIGSVHTRVVLLDKVDDQFRLMARAQALTTAEPPISDVSVGLSRALTDVSNLVGRALYSANDGVLRGERADGSGVDVFVATASGGRPMRTVIIGLSPEVSILSGRRALASTYIEVVEVISFAEARTPEENINLILSKRPELLLIVGGTNFGATEPMLAMLRLVRQAVVLARNNKPAILYAGNEALRPTVSHLLAPETNLFMTGNVRPVLDNENLSTAELELALVYGEFMAKTVGGFSEIQQGSLMGVLATGQSYRNITRYLGALPGGESGVLLVDVGSSTTTVSASINRHPYIDIRTDLGLGHSAVSAVAHLQPADISRWLSFEMTDVELMDYALNKSVRPATVPQIGRELEIEYALARELIRTVVDDSRARWDVADSPYLPPVRQIIGAGSVLAQAINPGVGALIVLDALQPTGVVRLKLDPYGVIPALGSVAYVEPMATVQVLENGGLFDLGTAICPTGRTTGGTAITATVKFASGRTEKHQVEGGRLKTVSLPVGQKATVQMKFGRGLRLNGKTSMTMQLEGGAAGLIFDARGRPFSLPKKPEDRKQVLQSWYAGVRS